MAEKSDQIEVFETVPCTCCKGGIDKEASEKTGVRVSCTKCKGTGYVFVSKGLMDKTNYQRDDSREGLADKVSGPFERQG